MLVVPLRKRGVIAPALEEDTADAEYPTALAHWSLPFLRLNGSNLSSHGPSIPPERLPFARHVFTLLGGARDCRVRKCRRMKSCQGRDGPPCFRADREDLSQVLLLSWMMIYGDMTEEECAQAMRRTGNRYAPARGAGSRKRRRADAAKSSRLG